MNMSKDRFYKELKERYPDKIVTRTYGYITKYNRIKYGVEKSHISDARMISKMFRAEPLGWHYKLIKVRRHNRQLYKFKIWKGGKLKRNQAPYEVMGFRLFDVVDYEGKEYYISARRTKGYFALRDSDGNKVTDSVSCKKLKLKYRSNGYIRIFKQ